MKLSSAGRRGRPRFGVWFHRSSPRKRGPILRRAVAMGPRFRGDDRLVRSGIHVAAVDRDGLAGDEVAVRRGEKYQRAEEVLRMLVALQRARLHGAVAGGAHVARILAEHG